MGLKNVGSRTITGVVNLIDVTQSTLEAAMHGASLRHTVLAGNIANANTRGYQRRDVDFQGTLREALASGAPAPAAASFTVAVDPGVVRADGNGVNIDVESARLAENDLAYESLAQVARARVDIIESAIGAR